MKYHSGPPAPTYYKEADGVSFFNGGIPKGKSWKTKERPLGEGLLAEGAEARSRVPTQIVVSASVGTAARRPTFAPIVKTGSRYRK